MISCDNPPVLELRRDVPVVVAAELGEHTEYLLLDADRKKVLQLLLPRLQLALAELGELDDALHVEDNSGLVSKVTGTNQALREQLRTKL